MPVTFAALREIALRRDDSAARELAAATRLDDHFLRRLAVELLAAYPQVQEAKDAVVDALSDPSEYVTRTACEVVAKWALTEAREAVIPLISTSSAATRFISVRTLGVVWASEDFPQVFQVYKEDRDVRVRREAASVLQERVGTVEWRAVFEAFRVDPLARHRRWACNVAERFGAADVLQNLKRLASDKDGHVRSAAVRAGNMIERRANLP